MNAIVFAHADAHHPLMRQWAALGATTPFNGWEVFQAWDAARGPDEQPFVIAVSDAQERLAAVAPWCLVRDQSRVRMLTGIGGEDAWYHDPLIVRPEHDEAIARTLIRTLRKHARDWDKLGLILRKGEADAFQSSIRQLGLSFEERLDWRQYQGVVFEEAWSEYWERRPDSLKSTVKRRGKRLASVPHRFYLASADEAEAHWEAVFRMQVKRMPDERDWKTYHALLRTFLLAAKNQGSLRPYALEIEGTLAAVLLFICVGNQAFDLTGAIDDAFGQYSPGTLLTCWALEQMHGDGVRRYDPGPGDYTWKSKLTSDCAETLRIETVIAHASSPGSWRGAADLATSGLLIEPLKRNPMLRRLRDALQPARRIQPTS